MKIESKSIYEFNTQTRLILAAFRLLSVNSTFLRNFYPMLNPSHWAEVELKWITEQCMRHFEQYQKAPRIKVLRMRLDADTTTDEEQKKLILRIIDKLDDFDLDPVTRQFIEDNFEPFIQYRATLRAIETAQQFIEEGELDKAVQVVQESQKIRRYNDNWLSLPEDADRFFEFFDKEALLQATIPIGLAPLDEKLSGGARRKELGVIIAPLGYGKSQFLVHIGAEAMRRGFNVAHFSFENSAEETLARYMYNLLSIDSDVLQEYNLSTQQYIDRKEDMEALGGQLKIMRLIGSQTTCIDLSGYLERLSEHDWTADLVVVDYGDLMTAAHTPSAEAKKYEELKAVFEELRDLAAEKNVVLWTAAQANREGLKGKRVLTHHIADALGKAFVADIIISMSKEMKERAGHKIVAKKHDDEDIDDEDATDNGIRILHLLKMRRGGSDNWWAPAKTKYAQAKLVCEKWAEEEDYETAPSDKWGAKHRKVEAGVTIIDDTTVVDNSTGEILAS